jgi:membrane protein DedA with SNARE-associated domain
MASRPRRVCRGVNLHDYGLLGLFVVCVVPLAPTEPILIADAVLAATTKHGVSPVLLVLVSGVGCSISDHILYGLSRFGGARVLDWAHRRASAANAVDWLSHNINRWGVPTLILGRWLPAGGTVGSILAGALRWRLPRFSPTSLAGCTLWSVYVVTLGYLGGSIAGNAYIGMLLSLGAATVVATATRLFMRRGRHKRALRVVDPPPEAEEPAA